MRQFYAPLQDRLFFTVREGLCSSRVMKMKDPYYLHGPFFITNYDFFTFGTDYLLYF